MAYILKKFENLKNSIYSIPFDKNDFSQLKQNPKNLVASVFPTLSQAAYSGSDFVWWFINGYLWNVPEIIMKYGGQPSPEFFSKLSEYASQMTIAQGLVGTVGWVSSLFTIYGIKKIIEHNKKVKPHM